ncbi:MAG: phage tail protein [Citromicrobium sp.]|nr:phage tail protein [Citromicrobium sp.]
MEPLIGELMLYTGDRAPQGWEVADGRELDIAANMPLFSIIGPRFGGDGRKTFALPDLRDAAPAAGTLWCIAVEGHYPVF